MKEPSVEKELSEEIIDENELKDSFFDDDPYIKHRTKPSFSDKPEAIIQNPDKNVAIRTFKFDRHPVIDGSDQKESSSKMSGKASVKESSNKDDASSFSNLRSRPSSPGGSSKNIKRMN